MKGKLVVFARIVVFVLYFVGLYARGQEAGSNLSATVANTAAVPRLVQFNGVAKDSSGKPMTGILGITFLLYSDEQGGSPLWMETQNVQADAKGSYSAQLGVTKPDGLPADAFNSGEARWLAVQVADHEEQPRVLLLAVPYALKAADASTIGGLPPSAFVRVNPENLQVVSEAPGMSTSTAPVVGSKNPPQSETLLAVKTNSPGATIGFLPVWAGSKSPTIQIGSSALFQSGSNVGIGTTAPGGTLDVNGNAFLRGTVNLTQTSSATTGVVEMGSNPFLHACCSSSASNTFLGANAGNFTGTGNRNTGSGTGTLHSLTFGAENTAFGYEALNGDAGGSSNTAVGDSALFSDNSGFNNTAIGFSAMLDSTTGTDNTAVGDSVLNFNSTGSFNTAVGETALGLNTTGSFNTGLGYAANVNSNNLTNATAIGTRALVGASNSMVLGSISGVNGATANTNVGIGTTTPSTTLDVKGDSTYEPLLVESPNTFGTWIQLANTSTGGLTWYMLSAASGNGEGAGNLAFTNSNFNGTGTVFIHANLHVDGTVSKGGGSFQIDHPLDPANKYLYHSFVESPDMMDIYNGNVTTNKRGLAVIVLPSYFEALNRDFRYQLTPIGQFAEAMVAKEIGHGRFTIKTNRPGVKVSWQVTGIRHDAYANAHRIQVEEEKAPQEHGKYLHPELFGAAQEQAIGYSWRPEAPSTDVATNGSPRK